MKPQPSQSNVKSYLQREFPELRWSDPSAMEQIRSAQVWACKCDPAGEFGRLEDFEPKD